jgi:hypothetical protein
VRHEVAVHRGRNQTDVYGGSGGVESTRLWSLLASNRSPLNLRKAICDIYLLKGLTAYVRGVLAVALRVSSEEVARSSLIRVVQNIPCPPNYPTAKSLPTRVLAGRQPITRHP